MSKAFTKEDDGTQPIHLEDLPQSRHPNPVTPAGLSRLEARLAARQEDLRALKEIGAEADNRLEIAVAARDIRYLEGRLARAVVIDPSKHPEGIVAFGAEVEVLFDDDTRRTFRIVSEDEADPSNGLIAPYSPLGVALLGAELGSSVEWAKPFGAVELEITAIRFT